MLRGSDGGAKARTAILLVNPKARSGSSSIDDVRALLSAQAYTFIEPPTRSREDICPAIHRHAREADCVIVGGGDGSLNAAAPALRETGLPLGILPLGTANDLARTLGIAPDLSTAAEVIAGGKTRRLDLGEVNGHPFFNVASIGFSAVLARNLTTEAKKRLGTLGYAATAARLLWRNRPFTVFIDHDGTTEQGRTVQISVGNGRYYGGGMTVESTAQPDDGRLDVYSLEVANWRELLMLAPALRRGTQGQHRNVRAFGTTELTIRTRRPHDVNTDGELVTHTPAHFRILKAAVTVFVP